MSLDGTCGWGEESHHRCHVNTKPRPLWKGALACLLNVLGFLCCFLLPAQGGAGSTARSGDHCVALVPTVYAVRQAWCSRRFSTSLMSLACLASLVSCCSSRLKAASSARLRSGS